MRFAHLPTPSSAARVLARGVLQRLQVCPETLAVLERRGIPAHVLPTPDAVRLYNELTAQYEVGGLDSTC